MAETNTFTVDTTTQTETMSDNLTADEQDSLAVGEKIVEGQQQLLAGKYKDAQELEKAYVELQKKLGSNKEESNDTEKVSAEDEKSEEKSELSDHATLINSASDEYFKNGNKLSDETMAKFSSLSTQDLIKAYMEVQAKAGPQQQSTPIEITTSEINEIKNSAGGEKAYADIVNWAKSNLDQKQIDAFDEVINTGSVQAIRLAVAGLKSEYNNANGVEGRMVTGKTAPKNADVFRSQAELVQAMNDRRYDRDPAYRQDVIDKLDRSDLNF
tara:strand:+ start:388 stop:1197 length:810 start_codon:yes stop_codon:yes gene_type:complete